MSNQNVNDGLTNEETIAFDFILMGYSIDEPGMAPNLVGVDNSRKKLKIYKYKNKSFSEMNHLKYKSENEIHMIIPSDYNFEGKQSYAIIEKNEDFYSLRYLLDSGTVIEYNKASKIMPLLLTYDNVLKSKLLIQSDDNEVIILELRNGKIFEENLGKYDKIVQCHSSTFLNNNGNIVTDLLMVVNQNNHNYITDMKSTIKIELPSDIGPILFLDYDNDGLIEMIYISKENNDNYFLNIQSMDENKIKKIDLKSIFGDEFIPVTKLDELDNIGGGIFAVDIKCDGNYDIILTMKKKSEDYPRKYLKILEKYKVGDDYNLRKPTYADSIEKIENPISVSSIDHQKNGKENLLINYRENDEYKLVYFKNNLNPNYLKLRILGVDVHNKMPIPGIGYQMKTLSQNLKRIGVQMSQGTFLHLQSPYIFWGLGSMNILIDELDILIPKNKIMLKNTIKIIPNSDLLIKIDNNSADIELFLNINKSIKNVLLVTLLVLVLNMAFLYVLYTRDKRRDKRKRRSEKFSFNFDAL